MLIKVSSSIGRGLERADGPVDVLAEYQVSVVASARPARTATRSALCPSAPLPTTHSGPASPTSTGADNVRYLIKGMPVRDAPSFYYLSQYRLTGSTRTPWGPRKAGPPRRVAAGRLYEVKNGDGSPSPGPFQAVPIFYGLNVGHG